ncbi:MAG: S8 family peptidase [Imperialibacter sp.]|uniref:S8 family peptidase n=1 Tax=Imperialibacter sp. TaxID=2038411 RepID=UPI003A86084B
MIKARIKVALNKRGAPSVNASKDKHYVAGQEVNIVDLVNGDVVDGIDVWYKLDNGSFVWSGGVEGITAIQPQSPLDLPIDPELLQWPIEQYGINDIWKSFKGNGIKIGILDTGVQKDHPELVHSIKLGYNFVGNNDDYDDWDGHGTHCAGIIASKGLRSVFGVSPNAELYIAKIMNSVNSGIRENVLLGALDWMVGKVDIISISGGIPDDLIKIEQKIDELTGHQNIVVVAAIGNQGASPDGQYPAKYKACISVGAVDIQGKLWDGTVRYNDLTICAPGVDIKSTWKGSSYTTETGTSMATPFVSGIVALLKQRDPSLNPSKIKNTLFKYSQRKKEGGFSFNLIQPKSTLQL